MDIPAELKKLNLPKNSYIVVGSGILNTLGIRASKDIDLIVSQEVFDRFFNEGWEEDNWSDQFVIKKGVFDIGINWYGKNVTQLLEQAQIIDGIPYLSLDYVYDWKKSVGRKKDLNDLKLIDTYLSSK